jgi:hypothetical protein
MKKVSRASHLLIVLSCMLALGCSKKAPEASAEAAATEPTPAATAPAPTPTANKVEPIEVEPTAEQREQEKKKALMDYAKMEDQYLNDTKAQWASNGKASSTFGDEGSSGASPYNMATNVKGGVDGKSWTNGRQDIGFDWLEVNYDKPVSATEVRIVFDDGKGVESVNKIELQSVDGKWNTVWEGISDQKADKRGNRTWFVRSFEKTAYKVKSVKVTIANNLERGYKEIDAVQLVGE